MVAHSRELCNQIYEVYEKIIKGTGITADVIVKDADKKFKGAHILVTTHGSLKNMISGKRALDVSGLKCIVVDEFDFLFTGPNLQTMKGGIIEKPSIQAAKP